MHLRLCPNCGGEWFAIKQHYTLSDYESDPDGDPALVDERYQYRCVDCREILDPITADAGRVTTP